MIVADHAVEALAEHAGRIVVLEDGAIVLDGPPAEVFGRLASASDDGPGVPEVTAVAAAVGGRDDRALPVTIDEGVAWLGAAG